jgi:hypothetical protein
MGTAARLKTRPPRAPASLGTPFNTKRDGPFELTLPCASVLVPRVRGYPFNPFWGLVSVPAPSGCRDVFVRLRCLPLPCQRPLSELFSDDFTACNILPPKKKPRVEGVLVGHAPSPTAGLRVTPPCGWMAIFDWTGFSVFRHFGPHQTLMASPPEVAKRRMA